MRENIPQEIINTDNKKDDFIISIPMNKEGESVVWCGRREKDKEVFFL